MKKEGETMKNEDIHLSVDNDSADFLQSIYSTKFNETLQGRILTIDSLRGVAIVMVLMLHTIQYCVDERKLQDLSKTPYTLLLYYVGGMSGLFFVLSSLGTSISIFKRLYYANNLSSKVANGKHTKNVYNTGKNDFQNLINEIKHSQIKRSLMLITIGYLSQLFFFRILENNVIMHYSTGALTRLNAEQLEWVFMNPFVRNFILEGIGFSTMITSLVTLEVLSQKWGLQKIMKFYLFLITLVLLLNPILRVSLDHLTCCTPTDCSYYPDKDGFNTLSSPPEIILPPNNTCSILKNGAPITWTYYGKEEVKVVHKFSNDKQYTLCDFQYAVYKMKNTGGYRDFGKRPLHILQKESANNNGKITKPLNMSASSERKLACNNILNVYGKRDSIYGIHTQGLGNVGRLWCTVEVGKGTKNATFVGKICKLKPWWGRGTDIGYDEVKAAGVGGAILIILILQPLFGRFGIFAYLAPSLIGSFLGIVIIFERKSRSITGKNDKSLFALKLQWLRITLLSCFVAFFIGFVFFLLLIVLRSDDTALQAGSHVRLFCGGGEISLVVLLVTLVENNKGRLEWVKNRCRCARRFGSITLTLWIFQFLDLFICMFCKLDLVFIYIFFTFSPTNLFYTNCFTYTHAHIINMLRS
jgi:hypothetical protein